MMLLIVVYIFAVIAYYNYSQYFTSGGFGRGGNCDTLFRCAIIMTVYGLKSGGGGIGERLDPPLFGPNNGLDAYGRYLYEFVFWVVVVIIFLNVVFGTILDTFGSCASSVTS